jgi:hypothetical protein
MGSSVLNPKDMKPYTEYKVETEGNKTTCYIESVEGQPFSVLLSLDADTALSSTFKATCTIDGVLVNKRLCGKFPDKVFPEWQLNGKEMAEGRLARFEFGVTQFTGKSNTLTMN